MKRSPLIFDRPVKFEAVVAPHSPVAQKIRAAQRAKRTALGRGTSNILDDPNASASTRRA